MSAARCLPVPAVSGTARSLARPCSTRRDRLPAPRALPVLPPNFDPPETPAINFFGITMRMPLTREHRRPLSPHRHSRLTFGRGKRPGVLARIAGAGVLVCLAASPTLALEPVTTAADTPPTEPGFNTNLW